jgi:hypothetical protein
MNPRQKQAFPATASVLRLILVYLVFCSVAGLAQAPGASALTTDAGRPRLCSPVSFRDYTPVPPSHSHVVLMGDRYVWLTDAYNAGQRTGVPLVGYFNGRAVPAPCADDTGLYYLVPLVARLTHSSVDSSLNWVLLGTLFGAAVLGWVGVWIGAAKVWQRAFGILTIGAATYAAAKVSDVYIMQAATVLAIVPWALFLFVNRDDSRVRDLFLFAAGLFLGVAQWIRTHSGTPVILFLLVLIFGCSLRPGRKLLLVAGLIAGFVLPIFYSRIILRERDQYLRSVDADYYPQRSQHVFWHTAYIGLGYLNNPYVPAWRDAVGAETVAAVAPQVIFGSAEYESILKERVIEIFHKDRYFIAYTFAAKLGVIAVMLLATAGLGIVASIFYPKGLVVETAFWLAMAFAALGGFVGIPIPQYLLGMITLAILYNYVSVCYAVDHRTSHRILSNAFPTKIGSC